MKKKQYTIFETFVGAGGSHIGFKKNNFKSVYVNDNNIDCIKTLLLNNPEIEQTAFVDHNSIIDINVDNLLNRIKLEKGELDVMFGGIVCKGFSLAGERSPNDERNYFYHKQLELVNETKPKISIIENVKAFELEAMKVASLYPDVAENCMSVSFSHIFQGGYSSGYYSYKWAEVLDADAFAYFQEKGIFNQEVAASFKNNILSQGGTDHPMTLYKKFRGQAPQPEALLKRAGLL